MKNKFHQDNNFDTLGRATIVPSMSKTTGGGGQRKRKRSSKSRAGNSVRLVKGRVVLKVPGYQGVQRLSPSNLIQHINKKNLKSAAKSALRKNKTIKRRKRGRGRRGRKK